MKTSRIVNTETEKPDWIFEITPEKKSFYLNFNEIYRYRDLLVLFVRRDIVSVYKQTVLGPIWFFIQPILIQFLNTFCED